MVFCTDVVVLPAMWLIHSGPYEASDFSSKTDFAHIRCVAFVQPPDNLPSK